MDTWKLRILHLSDLHERGPRESSAWSRRRVLGDEWKRNLDELLDEDGGIDLVCFTGDVADWGKAAEYGPVTDFLGSLLHRLSLSATRLFLVPGNHDIDRKLGEAAWTALRKNLALGANHQDVSDWLAGSAPPLGFEQGQREQLLSRQAAYRAWLGSELGRPELLPDASLHPNLGYRSTLRLDGFPFPIHFIGLDSAWSAGDDSDAGKLLLTRDQVGRLTTQKGEPLTGFKLALVHHPLTDLADRSDCQRLLADNVDLLLRGHLHETAAEVLIDPDRATRQLAAGCLYEGHRRDQWPNACHVIKATLGEDGRPLRYDLHFRVWSKQGFWADDNLLYKGAKNGRLRWNLVPEPVAPPLPPQSVFVGRGEELKRLAEAVLPENRQPVAICALNGMPGVGKTYLAEQFYLRNAQRFPGGLARLAFDPQKPPSADDLLGQLADSFKLPASGPDLAARVRERLLRPLTLLLVENVDSKDCAEVAVALARHLPGCPLVVTGRFTGLGSGSGWTVLDIQTFDEATALDQLAQEWRKPRDAAERAEHVTLVRALGALPLAIHLAAGYLRSGHDVDGFLTALRDSGLALEPLELTDRLLAPDSDRARAVLSSTFQLSLGLLRRQLGADAEKLVAGFAALGHAPTAGVGRSLGAAIAGLSKLEFQQLLKHALSLSLVTKVPEAERPQSDAWRVHPLLAELLQHQPGASDGLSRMTGWFVERLPELPAGQEEEQGRRWTEIHQEGAALVSWLPRVADTDFARVDVAGRRFAIRNGPYSAWMDFYERALASIHDATQRSNLFWTLSQVALRCGASERALTASGHKAELDRQRGDERGVALALGVRADILQTEGLLDEALRIHREDEIPVFEKLGDIKSRAVTIGKIADILKVQGHLDEVLRIRREEELPVYEKLGDVRSRAVTLGNIADVLEEQGHLDEVLRIRREEELPVYEKLGDIRSQAMTLGQIANILDEQGNLDEALRIFREQVPVYEKLDDVRSRAVTLGRIATILALQRRFDEAIRTYREDVLPVYEKLKDVRSLLIGRANLAQFYLVRQAPGDREAAAELLRLARSAAESLHIPEAQQIRALQQKAGLEDSTP